MFSVSRFLQVGSSHAADADAGDVESLAGRDVAGAAEDVAGDDGESARGRCGEEMGRVGLV